MKLYKKSAISVFLTSVMIISVPTTSAIAAESTGSLSVTSATIDSKNKTQLIGLAVSISDADGIVSSRVNCVNLAGEEIFSLNFRLDGGMRTEYKSRAGVREIPSLGSNGQIARFAGFRDHLYTKLDFPTKFAGKWKVNDQCMATLTVVDRLGTSKDVSSIPITFKEYLNPSLNAGSQAGASGAGSKRPKVTYKPNGVTDVFGCLLTGEDRSRIPDGLPLLLEMTSCGFLYSMNVHKGGEWGPLYPPGVINDNQKEYLSWRLAFGDILSAECKVTYDPRVEKYILSEGKTDAKALCSFIRNFDPRIKTKIKTVRQSSPYGARLDLAVTYKTR